LNKEELHALVQALWGVSLPRVAVCPGHTSPFDAFSEAFFGNRTNWVLWYGSRGTGKSYMLAILALTKASALDIDVTLLGGSMAQSQNVQDHVAGLLRHPRAPLYAIERNITTIVEFKAGNWIKPLPASQRTVRGPHPHMTLLDEIDEMDKPIYDAAMGQAMTRPNARGVVMPEMVVASSTWQNPTATFSKVLADARQKGMPVRTWCWREVVKSPQNPDGWMDPEFIERKRMSVPAEMFRVEYELGEPSGTSRAFDLNAVDRSVVERRPVQEHHKPYDDLWVWEDPVPWGMYATGADWAKEEDRTVITTFRIDVEPATLVRLRSMNRRPWPEMIEEFNRTVADYQGMSAHDATGIGNVVGDLIDERTTKMVMVGRDRTLMLTQYISAVERGAYSFPDTAVQFVHEHRTTSVDSVYNFGSTKVHLPDMVASAALAHRAALRGGWTSTGESVPKPKADEALLPWLKDIDHAPQEPRREAIAGEVVEVEDDDGIGVFWLEV